MNEDPEQLYSRALTMMRNDRWREAIRLLKSTPSRLELDHRFAWNVGWCYFKLERMKEARKYLLRALRLEPENHACRFGVAQVYLKTRQYKKAELILLQALALRKTHTIRISLALAYLGQGKTEQAEEMHLENIQARPLRSEPYESYAAFLSDVGREPEAKKMEEKARELRRIN